MNAVVGCQVSVLFDRRQEVRTLGLGVGGRGDLPPPPIPNPTPEIKDRLKIKEFTVNGSNGAAARELKEKRKRHSVRFTCAFVVMSATRTRPHGLDEQQQSYLRKHVFLDLTATASGAVETRLSRETFRRHNLGDL